MVQLAIFNERPPIPQKVVHAMEIRDSQAILGKEIQREGKTGVVREVEVDILMNLEVAKAVRDWLNEKVVLLENAQHELH